MPEVIFLRGKWLKKLVKLLLQKLSDRDNPWYGVRCGNSTFDRIFLLSYDEVVLYFGDSGALQNKKGFYCDKDGNFTPVAENSMYTKMPHGDAIYNQYNDVRKVLNDKGADDWWWLRSPARQGAYTAMKYRMIHVIPTAEIP